MQNSKPDIITLIGKTIRLFFPKTLYLPILKGRLSGKKWIVRSGNLECLLGNYEKEKMKLIEEHLSINNSVFDIGAHVGYYTLLASEVVGDEGNVVSFEPLPSNINYLKQHIKLNSCKNVKIIEAAVSEKEGIAKFNESKNNYQGHLSDNGNISVFKVSIDELYNKGELPKPDLIKIDVEGEELSVLKGAKSLLTKNSPKIFLATHNNLAKDIHKKCINYLISLGYVIKPIGNRDIDNTKEIFAYKKSNKTKGAEISFVLSMKLNN